MALPKIDQAIFELTLPSTNKKIKHRLFNVKEEKILLLAQEAKDPSQTILSVKQVVNNCLVDMSVDELAVFDLEYVLLVLRSKSVNNIVDFSIKDPGTDEVIKLSLDLAHIQVTRNPEHTNKIQIDDDHILMLRYPTINEFELMVTNGDNADTNFEIMISCFDTLLSGEELVKFSDYERKEVEEFAYNLEGSVVKKLEEFFLTMPKLRHEMPYTNSAGEEKTFVIEGMQTFFI